MLSSKLLFFTEEETFVKDGHWVRQSKVFYPDKNGLFIGVLYAYKDKVPFKFIPESNLGRIMKEGYREVKKIEDAKALLNKEFKNLFY